MAQQRGLREKDIIVAFDDTGDQCWVQASIPGYSHLCKPITLDAESSRAERDAEIDRVIAELLSECSAMSFEVADESLDANTSASNLNAQMWQKMNPDGSVTFQTDTYQFVKDASEKMHQVSDSIKAGYEKNKDKVRSLFKFRPKKETA